MELLAEQALTAGGRCEGCLDVRPPAYGLGMSTPVRASPRLLPSPTTLHSCRADLDSPSELMSTGDGAPGRPSPDRQGRITLAPHRGPVEARGPDRREVTGGKGSIFFRAHSYHTKVPVEGLVRLLEHYTEPGALVADPFCGSGQLGVAAVLAGRHAFLSDLSPAAVHIARGYTNHVDPGLYRVAAEKVICDLDDLEADLYGADGHGRVEYRVFSDVFRCPTCSRDILFWAQGVDHERGSVAPQISCPSGHGPFPKKSLEWVASVPVQANISLPGQRARLVQALDGEDPSPVRREDIRDWYPTAAWESWREMWRAQHAAQAIETAADFYTPRNLLALAAIWERIGRVDDQTIRDALRFTFTAIVNRASRRYQWHPLRPTNVLSSTMYVASLNYEFNVFSLFRRKLTTIAEMYGRTWTAPGTCEVHQGSATNLPWLPAESVDYVFTDPPFGSNIYYGDSSFLWESWLDDSTDVALEAVVNKRVDSSRGGKGLDGYEDLMDSAMSEVARVLRPNAWASLQFHNSDDAVWSSIGRSVERAGFAVGSAVVMDKGQLSFKGLRHAGKGEKVTSFDLVMHLCRGDETTVTPRRVIARDDVITEVTRFMGDAPPSRRTTPWAHSTVMRFLLANGADLGGWSFAAVEAMCEEIFDREGTRWAVRA